MPSRHFVCSGTMHDVLGFLLVEGASIIEDLRERSVTTVCRILLLARCSAHVSLKGVTVRGISFTACKGAESGEGGLRGVPRSGRRSTHAGFTSLFQRPTKSSSFFFLTVLQNRSTFPSSYRFRFGKALSSSNCKEVDLRWKRVAFVISLWPGGQILSISLTVK